MNTFLSDMLKIKDLVCNNKYILFATIFGTYLPFLSYFQVFRQCLNVEIIDFEVYFGNSVCTIQFLKALSCDSINPYLKQILPAKKYIPGRFLGKVFYFIFKR